MPEVPKIVGERLKAATPAVDHPDADVLTSFSERSLPERERAALLEHLARCRDCRDIVALSLPAIDPVQTHIKASPAGWFSWPALRWGVVAAGIVVVASFGILQYQGRMRRETGALKPYDSLEVAANHTAADRAPADQAKNEQVAAPAAPASSTEKKSEEPVAALLEGEPGAAAPKPAGEAPSLPAVASRAVPGGQAGANVRQLPHGPRVALQQQQTVNALRGQAPVSPPPAASGKLQTQADGNMKVPSSSQVVEVTGEAPVIENSQAQVIQNGPPQIQDQSAAQYSKVDKAKSAVSAQNAAPAPAPSTPVPYFVAAGAAAPASGSVPRWTISSSGTLQRSFDNGTTWQDVDVNANPMAGAKSLDVMARAKVAENKPKKQMTPAFVFRAVAAAGPDVWAGGSQGLLYHSFDAGTHWAPVVPAADGTILTGDIVSLQSPDPQTWRVSTSTGEIWTTNDEGQTWQKQ